MQTVQYFIRTKTQIEDTHIETTNPAKEWPELLLLDCFTGL